jgi:hypothetical protein
VISPADAGEISWDDTDLTLEASEDWTGDFTLKVRATNICGDGEWSEELMITLSQNPDLYAVGGGGAYCEGGEGVEITLDGSQEGVDYELYLDAEATGNIISGNGSPLSFTNITAVGLYEVIGFNDNCEAYMMEQVEVVVNALPTPEISGLDMVCDNDVTEYETTENEGSTYTWEVTGGEIIDGQGTYMATIEWGDAGEGTVTVTEEDANMCSATTEAFEVFIDDCTDISENGIENGFRVYPNPANNILNLSFEGVDGEKVRLFVYNQLGQVVIEKEFTGQSGMQSEQINISGLQNGLYIIKIISGNNDQLTKRIIKN